MNNTQLNQTLFLPPIDNPRVQESGNAGEWDYQNSIAFGDVAESLALSSVSNKTDTVSSIPDMWARPLLVDMVLRNSNHPLHNRIKAQWKGMLAAIALAEVHGFKLKAKEIDLEKEKNDPFIASLFKLIPDSKKASYQLTEKRKNPWEKIYVFLWQDKPVGMTSPATLVCPSEEGEWTDLPWWKESKLCSPIDPRDELTEDEKIQLSLWLDNLLKELDGETGDGVAIKGLIREFKTDLSNSLSIELPTQMIRPSKNQQYFGTRIALGGLQTLNNPIGAKKEESSLKLITKGLGSNSKVLFIPNTEKLLAQWSDKEKKHIWVYDTTLISFDEEEFRRRYRGEYLTEEDLFLDNFYFLKGSHKFLPGALLPEGYEEITYSVDDNEYQLTPLLPINPKLLDYFTAEELQENIKLRPLNLGAESGIQISITLPLSGGEYTVSEKYSIQEAHAILKLPFLEVWPNFRTEGWHEYYAFYFDDRTDKKQTIFQANFPAAREIHAPEEQNFQITRLDKFPSFIVCRDSESQSTIQGLILLKTPPLVGHLETETWTVGVDFGTSFTNVYYLENRNPKPLELSSLHLQVTATTGASRLGLLYDYFMSAKTENFPLSTVLTTLSAKEQKQPIFDGRLFIPESLQTFDPNLRHIKTELKWSKENLLYNRLFLKHLALLISAQAAQNHVRNIEWTVSYPSAFSSEDRNFYKLTWQNIIEELETKTGMTHKWLPKEKGNYFRTESLALAHYFWRYEGENLAYATCIDMGGGTSDISIWQGRNLLHQCSVKLAGRDLLSQFMKQKVDFLTDCFFEENEKEELGDDFIELAKGKRPEPFYVKLDALLISKGEKWLKDKRPLFDDDPNLQDIVQLSTLGISGLYYYVGIILDALSQEGKYQRDLNTPIYIGGNGSRIFNWLALGGKFDGGSDAHRLFSRMLSEGSGFEDTREKTVLSSQPKAEVACGLVLDQRNSNLRDLHEDDDDAPFAGEECCINGEIISFTSQLKLEGQINTFTSQLSNLKDFLDKYHDAIKELKLKRIKPLKCYKDDNLQEKEKLWRSVDRIVEDELLNMTGDANEIRIEPPFVTGLKALLTVLNQGNSDEQS
ncbi:MAG: hypothetical protein QNJ55_32025 [Xenococcus sp. MO_188.B8]|nr:hypothetical protein [Xenococcus sp. MO_188.B8]